MLGDDYIAQHIQQCILQESRERIYRQYITDSLFCISGRSQKLVKHWTEIDRGWLKPVKEEDPEEIKSRLLRKLREEEND